MLKICFSVPGKYYKYGLFPLCRCGSKSGRSWLDLDQNSVLERGLAFESRLLSVLLMNSSCWPCCEVPGTPMAGSHTTGGRALMSMALKAALFSSENWPEVSPAASPCSCGYAAAGQTELRMSLFTEILSLSCFTRDVLLAWHSPTACAFRYSKPPRLPAVNARLTMSQISREPGDQQPGCPAPQSSAGNGRVRDYKFCFWGKQWHWYTHVSVKYQKYHFIKQSPEWTPWTVKAFVWKTEVSVFMFHWPTKGGVSSYDPMNV